jgi:hypothetical protein
MFISVQAREKEALESSFWEGWGQYLSASLLQVPSPVSR